MKENQELINKKLLNFYKTGRKKPKVDQIEKLINKKLLNSCKISGKKLIKVD